jgi:hypothetical protein
VHPNVEISADMHWFPTPVCNLVVRREKHHNTPCRVDNTFVSPHYCPENRRAQLQEGNCTAKLCQPATLRVLICSMPQCPQQHGGRGKGEEIRDERLPGYFASAGFTNFNTNRSLSPITGYFFRSCVPSR